MEYRLLGRHETDAAAALHRRAAALIPGYTDEGEAGATAKYAHAVAHGTVWGAFRDRQMAGLVALEPGWIEHLYVEPERHRQGIGRALVALAQREQDELRLVTYRANTRARRLYEAAGFVADAYGVDETSPAREPNVRYRWRRGFELRRLRREETGAAAALHRRSMATIPGIDVTLHTPEQDRAFYAGRVFARGPILGAFLGGRLVGHLASSPGWIDQLYVDPAHHGQGVGRALLLRAQGEQDDLRLWTFQANARARRFYAAHGFTEEEMTDGSGNEERLPDVRLRWRRAEA